MCISDLCVLSGHPLSSEGFSLLILAKMVSCHHQPHRCVNMLWTSPFCVSRSAFWCETASCGWLHVECSGENFSCTRLGWLWLLVVHCWPLSVNCHCPGQLGLPVSREVVLEHIVERKRIDDLAGSIMDGRFHEQKVCYLLHITGHRFSYLMHIGYSFVCTTVVCDIQSTWLRSMVTLPTSRCRWGPWSRR